MKKQLLVIGPHYQFYLMKTNREAKQFLAGYDNVRLITKIEDLRGIRPSDYILLYNWWLLLDYKELNDYLLCHPQAKEVCFGLK